MKILIDDMPMEDLPSRAQNFPEFCEEIMAILLARNLSIGSCEFDGRVVCNLEEANDLFQRSEICKIASIPLAAAMEAALNLKCREMRLLESDCEDLVTDALLVEPEDISIRWQSICEGIKAQIGFLPRLAGLLTETQVNQLADRQLKEIDRVMTDLHVAFNKGDTVEISDSIELSLLPWLKQLRVFLESCLQVTKSLHR